MRGGRAVALVGLACVAATAAIVTCPVAVSAARTVGERTYELVTPLDKAGGTLAFPGGRFDGDPAGLSGLTNTSESGDVVSFYTFASFDGARTGLAASYRAVRTPDGWKSVMWSPATAMPHPSLNNGPALVRDGTHNLDRGYIETSDPLDPQDHDGDNNLGMDVYIVDSEGRLTLASRPSASAPPAPSRPARYVGHSRDGGHVLFTSPQPLTGSAASHVAGSALYEFVDGDVRLVGIGPDGRIASACGSSLGHPSNFGQGAISADAERIFFTAPHPGAFEDVSCFDPSELYMRQGGSETVLISRSQRSAPDPVEGNAEFSGATADGEHVFFVSGEALTDDASPGTPGMLYRYDVSSRRLHLLYAGDEVIGVSAFSDDGSHVYFMTGGTLDNVRLRLHVGGATKEIAWFPNPTFDFNLDPGQMYGIRPTVRVTPDGRYLLFTAKQSLTAFDSQNTLQVYRFDAVTDELICISCNAAGETPIDDSTLGGDLSSSGLPSYPAIRNMTNDGRHIFFDTPDPHVPQDVNSTYDVYEWHDGALKLLSDGQSRSESVLFDVSADARDVFIGTAASLVPEDRDGGDRDIYDARIDGGFPSAPSPAPPCTEDACQGSGGIVPAAPSIVSVETGGVEDAGAHARSPARRVAPRVTGFDAAARRRLARGGTVMLRLAVDRAGVGTATANSTSRGLSVVVARAKRRLQGPGTMRLPLRLSRAARRHIAQGRQLRITVVVRFNGARVRTLRTALSTTTRVQGGKR